MDLWRIHRAARSAWWFSSNGSSRFDLASPEGTCYLSLSSLGAFVEVFRDFTFVDERDVAVRALSRLHAQARTKLADCTSARARGFGVTAAIHTTPDYATTQSWASAFRNAGFDGVRYFCGHDPSQREIAVALFGNSGEAAWPVASTTDISDDTIGGVERRFGIHVLPAP